MSKAVIIPECNKDIGGMKQELSISPNEKKDGAIGIFSRLLRLDALSKRNNVPDSPTSVEPPVTYYGVYIPCEIKKGPDEEALHVYKNKSEALELVRRYKLARFKAFKNRQDAVSFALRGAEPTDNTDGNDNSLMGEKPYPFNAPSPQDMVALRKAIEAGLACTVRDRVWDNPRFLVSSGNTPAIMQEGSRYNALHIAAKSMNADICNLILTTVGNPAFVQTLYGMDADAESCKEFASILVDRYLNTPDKAMNETPLHFAAKFGAEQVVDVLTSFPQCNRTAVNKFGEQPKDIICKRASASSSSSSSSSEQASASRIASMLQQRYYVPVLHCEDDSAVPTVGRPFTPANPPEINPDPLSPRLEILAFAGPMQERDAETFRRRWKTPPRNRTAIPFRLKEMTKGLETVGRNLAEELKVGWKEYWPFLDTFTDLRTTEGLTLLENYLKAKYESACSFAYSESCMQSHHSPDDLSISRISLGSSQHSPITDSVMSPISELCVALKTCKISDDRPPHWNKTDPVRQRMCRQPSAKTITNNESAPANHTVSQLLCIERTCQVFAKRVADALNFSLTAKLDVASESLRSEAKHLQHTIFTYMDDERFQSIDFALIHSRLAQLVVYKLKQQTKDLDDVNSLVEFLVKLRCPNDDIFSSDEERKPLFRGSSRTKMTHVIDEHVRCLSSFICEELIENDIMKGPAISEIECADIWDRASKCICDWKIEFERNSKKNASFRKNRSILSTSPKNDSFIRRLNFEHDIGDGGKLQPAPAPQPVSVNSPAGDSAATHAHAHAHAHAHTHTHTPQHTPPSTPPTPPTLFTVKMDKCQVVDAEISEDDSVASCESECEEAYDTAEESARDADDMADASDHALAEPYIYGDEPTKMDRLVFEALSQLSVNADQFPHVYRWRHSVALHSQDDRDKWPAAPLADDTSSCASWVMDSPCSRLGRGLRPRRPASPASPAGPAPAAPLGAATPPSSARCSTPVRDVPRDYSGRGVSLQVSNWLRVTGPNSPRSALASKNVGHNVSFGF